MFEIPIEFYGQLSDSLGKQIIWEIAETGMSIDDLREDLAQKTGIDSLLRSSTRSVINDQFVPGKALIARGDIIAFMSPLSGG